MSIYNEMLEEVIEFSQRFPDLSDREVLEHVEYVFNEKPIREDSPLARAIISVYNTRNLATAMVWLHT